MAKETNYYIKAFDGMRGAFVPPVLMTHLGCFDFLYQNGYLHRVWITISGSTALYGFFVLSGFLITTILLKEKSRKGSISAKKFFIRRALRLFPPLFIFYGVLTLLMLHGSLTKNSVALMCSFFYCYNFIPNKFWSNELSHTWSLSVEEQFYLMWVWVIKYLKEKSIYKSVLIVFILSFAALLIYPHISYNSLNKVVDLTYEYKTERFLIPAICPVLIGCSAALFCFNRLDIVVKVVQHKWLFAIGLFFLCCPLYLPYSTLQFAFIFQSFGIAVLIVWVAYKPKSIITLLLENSFLVLIGQMSYSIYIWQGLFLGTGPTSILWFQQFPQNLFLTFMFAASSYFFLEKPIMNLKNKFSGI